MLNNFKIKKLKPNQNKNQAQVPRPPKKTQPNQKTPPKNPDNFRSWVENVHLPVVMSLRLAAKQLGRK